MTEEKNTIDTVQVALRIRPLMRLEIERHCDECIEVVPGQPQVQIKDLAFTYNYVFPQHITQQEFYDTSVKGLIGKLFQGYNVTILAYGQTGSGKTYTMGTNYSGSNGDSTKLGVIPMAVADIFDFIETHEDKYVFKVTVSFMELYQEQCYDLLSGKERSHSIIEIREDINKGVILPGITELPVTSTNDTMMVLERGSSGRVTGSTAMNQASSRSHAVFTIVITKESRTDKNLATTSKFHLVDLAGSERIKKTKASGERLKEGVKINQGLLALGNVISALGDGTNRSFISYRDSKLTRLLQDSLGGNSLTLMVACVSPADYNLDETVSTLRYADRARRIRNKPIINQDAKAAEIIRLNNLVNELRLKLLGQLPTISEQNNEQLQDELDKERAKYAELLKKHKLVTEHLGTLLIDNTNLCEKALMAEAAKDKLERKLNELTEQCNQTIENINMTEKNDDDQRKSSAVDYLKEIKTRLEDLQSLNLKANEELIEHEIKTSYLKDDSDNDKVDDDIELNEDQVAMEEEKRAMGQVALNQELQELNRAMAYKASIVKLMLANNKEMEAQNNLKENEEKIAHLEKERDELLQQLKQSKTKDPSHEQRRVMVTSLEAEISDLKKRCQQQANIIKTKEKNEAKIATLNAELQAMKVTKVKIIKQMREESEKFRKWKADNERAMLRLRNEDRKRATAMAKMESLHAKQQNVLKRKMEETVAVNKRLKEALDRQKATAMKRNAKGNLKVGAVQQYIEQELEVHLSIVEAEKSLEELMEYRAWIIEQIEILRNDNTNDEANKKKIAELEDDLALRKAQLSDLQQKILTADQENKSRTQWDNIQSMMEAKVALKCLFEMLVDAKREMQNQSDKGYQARYEEVKEAYDCLALEYENSKAEFETLLAKEKLMCEKKVATVIKLRNSIGKGNLEPACQHLQNTIQTQQEKLKQCEEENKKLLEELNELRAAAGNKKSKNRSNKDAGVAVAKKLEYVDMSDDDDDDLEDKHDDPDWRATPLYKRIQAQRSRLTMNFTVNNNTSSSDSSNGGGGGGSRAVKRSSDGLPHCVCRGACSSRACGCVKSEKGCGSSCRCQPLLCKNKRLSSDSEDNKENNGTSSDVTRERDTTQTSYFDKEDNLDKTYVKKKKCYFFPSENTD